MRYTLYILYLVEFANWNSQGVIGYGCGNGSSKQSTGYTDNLSYHTGTTQSSKTTYGIGTQYRYIEGLWDNVYDWVDGIYFNSNGMNIIMNPSNFSDSTGGTLVGVPAVGTPIAFEIKDVNSIFQLIVPSSSIGGGNTYSCDMFYYYSNMPSIYCGGDYSRTENYGLFLIGCGYVTDSYPNVGCRLMVLPSSRIN